MKKIVIIIFLLVFVFIPKIYAQDLTDSYMFESRTINISIDVSKRVMHIKEVIRVENSNPDIRYKLTLGKIGVNTNLNNYNGTYFNIYEDGEYSITYDKNCIYNDCTFKFFNIYNGETPIKYKNLEINIIKENGELFIGVYNDLSDFSKQEEDGNIYLSLLPDKNGYLEELDLRIGVSNPIEYIVERILLLIVFILLLVDLLIYFRLVKPLSKKEFTEMEEKYKIRSFKYGLFGSIYVVVYCIVIDIIIELLRNNSSVTMYNIVTDFMGVFLFISVEIIWLIYLINSYKIYKILIEEK